jgi:hypothetical protein
MRVGLALAVSSIDPKLEVIEGEATANILTSRELIEGEVDLEFGKKSGSDWVRES